MEIHPGDQSVDPASRRRHMGLEGEAISLSARITAAEDVYARLKDE